MEITKTYDGSTLTVRVAGRLNTNTAPELDQTIRSSIDGIDTLILDFADLDYISSAGLRVVLSAQKIMRTKGSMIVRDVKPQVMDVFEMTGFVDFLTIE